MRNGLAGLVIVVVIGGLMARPGAQVRDYARCRALFDLGQIDHVLGNHADAHAHLDDSLAIAREIGSPGAVRAVGMTPARINPIPKKLRLLRTKPASTLKAFPSNSIW